MSRHLARALSLGALTTLLLACGSGQAAPEAASPGAPGSAAPGAAPAAGSQGTRPVAQTAPPSQAPAVAEAPQAPAARPRAMASTTLQVPGAFRQGVFSQDRQLRVPEGFAISVYALAPGARSLTTAPWGELLISQPGAGRITGVRDADGDAVAESQRTILAGLQCPYGMAFRDGYLYVAQSTKVERFRHNGGETFGPAEVVVDGLPQSGCAPHHYRPLTFDATGAFYVAFGSSCNVCVEPDARRGTVWQFTPQGGGREFARGLRNVVDLTINPVTGELWGATNERDHLGDDVPPEPVTAIADGADYGWPYCFWNNGSWAVDARVPARNPGCGGLTPYYGLPAHTAPLGVTFSPQGALPSDMAGSAFVAEHGSWNHSRGVGYKVSRIPFADNVPQPAQDFVTGWMTGRPQEAWGRPVDIEDGPDGALYVSDDRAGAIYRITFTGP